MNTAARLVTRTRKFDHITPVLKDLHFFPIESRSKFKILLLVYKYLYGLAPNYLSKILSLKTNRGLRSDDKLVLNLPTTKLKTKTYSDRCFSIARLNLWNQLPSHIRLSKSIDDLKGLWRHICSKTHLTYSFILVMSYIYIFYIHIVTMHAISISSTFYSLFTVSLHMHIYIVIRQTISLFCIVLH